LPEPRIVAFLCEWCAYRAADEAGRRRLTYPQSLLSIRVMCTGRVEPAFVLQAFREGADGVLVAGCRPGSCHYGDGNRKAAARHALLLRLLAQLGISPERCRLEWVDGADPERFAALVREMTERLRALPPGPLAGEGSARAPERAPPAAREAGRPKVAFYWNAACGGCEESVLDLGEELAAILAGAEVVLWPLVSDGKRRDVEALPDGSIAAAFLSGAVRTSEEEDWSRLLRRKSRLLVALGACAHTGGVVGLGNLSGRGEILAAAYRSAPSLERSDGSLPGEAGEPALALPALLPEVVPLEAVAEVDAVVPGCPPTPELLGRALALALRGDLPRGAVLAPGHSLCEDCARRTSRPARFALEAVRDLATSVPDPTCFLAQGMACMGPATRGGCQAACVGVNVPCRGCFGPLPGAPDPGAAMLSALASQLCGDEEELGRLATQIPDPAGTFFRYGLARLPRRRGSGS